MMVLIRLVTSWQHVPIILRSSLGQLLVQKWIHTKLCKIMSQPVWEVICTNSCNTYFLPLLLL